jgi:hypothetical protein
MLTTATGPADNLTVPDRVTDHEGRVWTVTRAWPGAVGTVTFEASSADSRHVRGGSLNVADGAVLAPLGSDPRLPALAVAAAAGAMVVHRPGKRAVVRSSDGRRYVKVVRPGRAPAVLAAADAGSAFGAGFRVPAVLGGTSDTVDFQALRGRTLHDLGSDATISAGTWNALWAEWATGWAAVIGAGSIPARGRAASDRAAPDRVHSAEAEANVVRTWTGHAQRLLGPGAASQTIGESASRVTALLTGTTGDRLVPSHRDLHDKQVLWHPSDGLGLLDLDTATRAEAALDLGNLTAHLHLRHRQGLWDAGKARSAIEVVHRASDRLGVSPHRLHAYDVAARFRISCVYAYRPRWSALAGRLQRELADELLSTPGRAGGNGR